MCAALVAALPWGAAWYVRARVLPKLEERLGRGVTVGAVRVGWGRVVLDRVAVAGEPAPFAARRVTARFAVWPLLRGRVELGAARIDEPVVRVVRQGKADNVSALVERLRSRKAGTPTPDGDEAGRGPRLPTSLELADGRITVDDDALGHAEVARFGGTLRRDGASELVFERLTLRPAMGGGGAGAQADEVSVELSLSAGRPLGLPRVTVRGGAVRVWKGFALSGIAGSLAPDEGAPRRVRISLQGGYGGVDRVLWSAMGWAEPDSRQGELKLLAQRFSLGQLQPILAGTPVIDPEHTQLDAHLDLAWHGTPTGEPPGDLAGDPPSQPRQDQLDFDGGFHVQDLSLFHPRVAPEPVRHLDFQATARGGLQPFARTARLDEATFDFRGVHARLTADLAKLGLRDADGQSRLPAFRARFEIASAPCQTVLDALPAELAPALHDFQLRGTFKTELHVAIDPDDLDDLDLGGDVGIDGCRVVKAPPAYDAERWQQPFQHAVEVDPGHWIAFTIGPGNPNFVPYAEVSQNLVNSILTTEDSGFFKHHGFVTREFKSALRKNLEAGYFRIGASSITMQMVKNVLLSRKKTLSRKLQELFFAWYLEHHISKERILEIYFNAIEFGPGVYGIGRAARHYFGKDAKDLLPREAAFFSSILPNPKKRYVHYCRGPALDDKWEKYLDRILRRMHERERLTDEQFDKAMKTPLVFDRAEALPLAKCLDLVRQLTDPLPPGKERDVTTALLPPVESDDAPAME